MLAIKLCSRAFQNGQDVLVLLESWRCSGQMQLSPSLPRASQPPSHWALFMAAQVVVIWQNITIKQRMRDRHCILHIQ